MKREVYPRHPIRFGTDGWRAVIGEEYTFDNVRICSQAVADYVRHTGQSRDGLVVGYDTRFGSERFAQAVAEVLAGNGVRVYLCDRPQPTPVVSYAVLDRHAGGGVVVTASHNPAEYNGFKYKPEYAGSASPQVVAQLEGHIDRIQTQGHVQWVELEKAKNGGLVENFDAWPAYASQVQSLVDMEALRAAGLSVVADAMYGAGAGSFERLLSGGKTRVVGIRQERNPSFPGINPEPIGKHLEALRDAVLREGAALGLATDGDADRLGPCDESGRFINQHQVFALLFYYFLEVRGMRGPAVRTVTMTSMADLLGQHYGVPVFETAVGFKFVGPKMTEVDAVVGGEESGGFGFRGHVPERDAILSGLYLLDLMVKRGKPISAILQEIRELVGDFHYDRLDLRYPDDQREAITQRVAEARPQQLAGSPVREINAIDGYKFLAEDGSWLLIRFSGTEPLLRIYAETTSAEKVQQILSLGRQLAGL